MKFVFSSIDDPLEELKEEGLTIIDEAKANRFLSEVHPYFLQGYLSPFYGDRSFLDGTSFEDASEAYLFDEELRHLLLLYLEKVETKLKSVYSKELTKAYGETSYLNPSLYSDPIKHKEVLDKADKQRRKRAKHEREFSYFDKAGNPVDLPIYAFVRLLSIKDISDLYVYSPKGLKRRVASSLGFLSGGHVALEHVMRGLTFIRNQCAHGGRLFDFHLLPKACLSRKEKNLLMKRRDGSEDDTSLFGYTLMLARMLARKDLRAMGKRLRLLIARHPSVDMGLYGFPPGWKKII